jgi:predicted RNase H-like nuclease
VSLVAIDMPLGRAPILTRRNCDNAVSVAYGARKCGTHSPSAFRPGELSSRLTEGFAKAGYSLSTTVVSSPGVIEVYPHPALVELACASERLPYKVSKVRTYWPTATPLERRSRLFQQWNYITTLLESEVRGVAARLPIPDLSAKSSKLKAYEDALDAIVCAWIAVCALEGRATPFGDENSAIWIPHFPTRPLGIAQRVHVESLPGVAAN